MVFQAISEALGVPAEQVQLIGSLVAGYPLAFVYRYSSLFKKKKTVFV